MIPKPLNAIAEPDIAELKIAGIQEGTTIEYKRELPGTRDEDKREFLADISSFANTDGGDILYGIDEDQGLILDIPGAVSPDFDAELLRLENLIRDGIAPRITASFRIVPCSAGKVLLIRVEKSWSAPHRVIFRGHDKFYARTSAGKFSLDVGQLRTAFLQSATLTERIKGFRLDRIVDIANNRTPVPLSNGPRLAFHIIPLTAVSGNAQVDVAQLHKTPHMHHLWSASGWDRRMTFEGVLIHAPIMKEGATSYAHFYRSGIMEAVSTSLLETQQVPGKRLIPHVAYEGGLLKYVPACFQSLQQIGVRPPIYFCLNLISVRGLRMAMSAMGFDYGNEIREENLILPEAIVEDYSEPPARILKPLFDRVWNACGLLGSQNFDAEGNWMPRRPF